MDADVVIERNEPIEAGSPIVAALFLADTAVFACAEQTLLLVDPDGGERRIAAHHGAILCAAAAGERIVTGGDDGRVVATSASGVSELIGTDTKRRWIDRVALGAQGALAWSAGKDVTVRAASGEAASLAVASTGGGIVFLPGQPTLAIAHHGGVTLWSPGETAQRLDCPGAHAELTISADGRYLVSAMQEPLINGWRLDDRSRIQLAGYAERVRAMDWTRDGRWLATSGAERLMLWPLRSSHGPTMPLVLAPYNQRVKALACNPRRDVVAVGYADGLALLVRIGDGAEILLRRPTGYPVSALAWNKDGNRIAIACEDGSARLLALH
jgi:WD40 repeat protein